MRGFDFSSWQAFLTTVIGLALITLIGVGIRLLVMQTIQQRRERENRQINERLRTLIAAYRTLGGSFTGDLEVDPTHLRELRRSAPAARTLPGAMSEGAEPGSVPQEAAAEVDVGPGTDFSSSDRSRRIRDAVEAALSDILLLGTDEQVRLAADAAKDLAAGRRVRTAELVRSLRDFIRDVLALEPVPRSLDIPHQGPTRPSGSGSRGRGDAGRGDEGRGGGRGGGGGGGAGAGMGAASGGVGFGMGLHMAGDAEGASGADDPR